jgi:hypothetical protein
MPGPGVRKQLFYLTSDQLCAYRWSKGRLEAGPCFAADQAGRRAFAAFLESGNDAPVCLLADLIEEDFQRLLLPHVGGRAGRELVRRKLRHLFRDTPYRHASIQGRDSAGRRDDRVLFCALTNPAIVAPWVALLEQQAIPLGGIYSASLLSAPLIGQLAIRQHRHLLLVTQQTGGLRESYFDAGQLKFSRLMPATGRDGVAVGIAGETNKTRQFLASIRLLARGDLLHTVIVAPAQQVETLRPQCVDGLDIAYHFIEMENAAARLGLSPVPGLAEPLLLALLGRDPPASHFVLPGPARFYLLWRARRYLHAGSAALLAGAVLWLSVNLWGITGASNTTATLRSEAQTYEARYRARMAVLPPAPDRVQNMKAAVLLDAMVAAQAPGPARMLEMLSAALDQAPQIRLLELNWNVRAVPASSLLAGIPVAPPQTLRIEAELVLGQNDYRSVLESMNHFTRELAAHPGMRVEVVQAPLDMRPSVKLSGKAGPGASDALVKLILNLDWKP